MVRGTEIHGVILRDISKSLILLAGYLPCLEVKARKFHSAIEVRTDICRFASAVGAPIVFFAGGFIYSLRDILSSLGNNDTAHTLAFGMW